MKKHTMHRPVLVLLAMCLAPGLAWAQDAAKGTASAATDQMSDDEVIVLSPFTIDTSKDKGYKATNSTSGTRLNTQIKQLPMNLEVITNDFIRDTGATNLREAMRYSSGVVLESQADAFAEPDVGAPQSAGANDPRGVTRAVGDSTVKLRGFVIEQVLRDGFRRQYSADWINIERVDIMRGPSALLYGVGSLGGVVNYLPKRPQLKPEYYTGLTVGTNSLYRGEFDFTGPMGYSEWKPAFRVTGSYQEAGNATDYYKEKHWTISPSFSFRPFKHTEIFIDNEFGHRDEVGVGFQNIRNNEGDAPSRNATWLTDIYDPITSQKLGERVDNRTFRWSGSDTYLKGPFRNNIIDITQQIGDDLFVRIGAAESVATFDSRQVTDASVKLKALDGTPQAARAALLYGTVVDAPISRQSAHAAPTVKTDAAIRYQWTDYDREELRDQVRADATYKLDLGAWGKHTFIAGVQYMKMYSKEEQYAPPEKYLGGNAVPDYLRYSYKNPNDLKPFRYGVQGDGMADNARVHLYTTKKYSDDLGGFAVYQGQFFKDKVTLIGGVRRDRSDAHETKDYIYEWSHVRDNNSRVSTEAPTATSPQIGLNVEVTKGLSAFALYSTGVVPNYYSRDGNGNIMPPTKAKNYEAGIKFDLAGGRVSGTISAYKIVREGVPRFLWWAPSPFESVRKGYDPAKPSAQVAWYATPDAFWEGIHNTAGKTVAQQVALAKTMWPSAFHALIDEVGAAATKSAAWSGPQGSSFWSWVGGAEPNTTNPSYTGNLYFPLINYSDPDQAAFMKSVHAAPGWSGNFYYTAGQQYHFGSGALGFGNAPNGSGAYVPMDDQARGWDASLLLRPLDELQIVANFAHVDRKITTRTYKFVKALYWPGTPWMTSDNNFGTLDSSKVASDVYLDVNDTTTYNQTIADYGASGDDSPRNTASLWVRYSFDKLGESMKGFAVGAGGNWEDNRTWFTGFSGGGGNVTYADGTRTLLKLTTKERYTFNAMMEYNFRLANKYQTRIALNVDNILNDTDVYGLVYAPGTTAKLSVSAKF